MRFPMPKWLRRSQQPSPGVIAASQDERDFPTLMSFYSLPDAERIPYGNFEQYACTAFAGNAVVFSVLDKRLKVFTEATFKFRQLSDKHLFGTPDLEKLENPWPGGTTADLLAIMELDASLAGVSYIRDLGDRLERLRPDWCSIISKLVEDDFGRERREIIGVWYDPVGDKERHSEFIPVDEIVIWTPIPDPAHNFIGLSWLTPVVREVNSDFKMTQFRDAFFENAATMNVVVRYPSNLKLDPDTVKRLRTDMQARHAGAANAFGTLFLDQGADLTVVGADMEGAAFDAIQAAGETRIAAAGGVPALVAGLRQGMAASEIGEYQQAMRAFADFTMRPLWRSACAALQKLINVPAGAQLWYDTTDISALQQGEQDKANTLQIMAQTMNTWIMAGFEPDSVLAAAIAGDPSLLKHSGLVSVQMQKLQAKEVPAVPNEDVAPLIQKALNGQQPQLALNGGQNGG